MNDTRRHDKYERLIEKARALEPATAAVAYPCNESALRAAIEAQQMGFIRALLVGPRALIEQAARKAKLELGPAEVIDTVDAEPEAAAAAARLASEGRAQLLMKGSLHTDHLMGAVVRRDAGLRTSRRISHCFVMDVPALDRAIVVTDSAINIFPTLEDKADIVQNAIDLCHALGRDKPLVAILSAMETINTKVPSTVEAAALCKMADRGQITGGILDGPLALDNAIDLSAARIKKIDSPVAGRADVLVVPDLEAGNMLAKSLTFMANADGAGVVLGARVPVVLTSRADSVTTRLASAAVGALVASSRRRDALKAVA